MAFKTRTSICLNNYYVRIYKFSVYLEQYKLNDLMFDIIIYKWFN